MLLNIGNRYSFSTKAPGILGARYERAKLSGSVDYTTANTFINVESLHRSVLPMLPVGTPVIPRSFTYYIFILESGETKVFADRWIDESSVVLVETVKISFTLTANNAAEAENIREAIALLGYTNFTLDIT